MTFSAGGTPSWPAVRDLLASRKFAVQIRMIDGELAFPDEEPSENWRELRFGVAGGMVTVKRGDERVELVVWGNADPDLIRAWNALTWAFAETGNGVIRTPERSLTATEYMNQTDLPVEFHS